MIQAELESLIESEMKNFALKLNVSIIKAATHHAIIIDGIVNEPAIIRSIAVYMVALITNSVEANLEVRADIIEYTTVGLEEIKESVIDTIGENNNLDQDFIEDERNPWLAEALIHLLLVISSDVKDIHPIGEIKAVGLVHDDPKDKGLDLSALYYSKALGLTIGECKAYKLYPNKAISNAMKFFDGVETNKKTGKRIRTQVQILRNFLPPDISKLATNGFWKNEKCYLTTPVYDKSKSVNWSRKRNKTLGSLKVPIENRLVIPLEIENFDEFFNSLADEMRIFVEEL
ncbi:hypothetical protein [Planococcus halocryophilus]|uniref:hypothetical protein n=1 Tax=Planococcus halocryophilus TaxID=1215089 RepID=UPI001F112BCA|nr:hypothetical protein [Planococcus halocryophilus]MCH4826762.1 hypothetical protein [Planococcus halocryophilus]